MYCSSTLLRTGPDQDRAALRADRLGAVDHQVHDDLLKLSRVGLDSGKIVRQLQPEMHSLRNGGLNQPADFAHQARRGSRCA